MGIMSTKQRDDIRTGTSFACPFCPRGPLVHAVVDAEGQYTGGLIHEGTPCDEFMRLEPLAYMRAVNEKTGAYAKEPQ